MTLRLVPATEEDRLFYRYVHHTAYRDDIEKIFRWDDDEQDAYADKDFDQRNPTIVFYNSKKVGVIGWQDKADHIWFGPLFILPEFQGKNIGSKILKEFMDRADKEKLPLRLQTLQVNLKAKNWYEKHGFEVIDHSKTHWQMEYIPK